MPHAFLISLRLLPVMVVMPIVFFARIPMLARLLLSFALACAFASGLAATPITTLTLPMMAGEVVLGMVMAFGFHAAHAGIDMAGRLVDTQMGLNSTGVFDPGTANVTSIMSNLLGLVFALVFIVLDMHHALLRSLSQMFTVLPPGKVTSLMFSADLAKVLSEQFLMAFMILVPVILGLWLADIAFAFLSRSMPQANIYFLAMPVKLVLGVLLMILALPMIMQRMPVLFEGALRMLVIGGAA